MLDPRCRLNDLYLERRLSDDELADVLAAALGLAAEVLAIVGDWAELNDRLASRPVRVLRREMAGDFPLRLDIHFARQGDLANLDEPAVIEALAERAASRLLIDDPAEPARVNAFILVSGVGKSRRVYVDAEAADAAEPALLLRAPSARSRPAPG